MADAAPDRKSVKNAQRAERLNWSKKAEDALRKEMFAEAHEVCNDTVRAFGDCVRATGLAAVIKCREQNAAMQECLKGYATEERFQALRERREAELVSASASEGS